MESFDACEYALGWILSLATPLSPGFLHFL